MHELLRRSDLSSSSSDSSSPSPGKRTLTSRLLARAAARPAPIVQRAPATSARSIATATAGTGFDLDGFLDFGGVVQRDGAGAVGADAETLVSRAADGSGSPLPADVRERFESGLGADLGGVRVHTGSASAEAAQAVGAHAYAVGQDIHFAAGQYQPSSADGLHLLAHEVAHTVQQAGGATSERQHRLEVSMPGDALEVEADRVADALVAGAPAAVSSASGGGLHRDPAPAESKNELEVKTKVKALCDRDFGGDYKKGFDHFDANHDGVCDKNEVIALLKAAEVNIPTAPTWGMIAAAVIEKMDTNGDGKVAYAEFDAVMNAK